MSRYVYKCRAKSTYVARFSFFSDAFFGAPLHVLTLFGGRFPGRVWVDERLDVAYAVLACLLLELAVLAMESFLGQLIALTLYIRNLVFVGGISEMGPFAAYCFHFLTLLVTIKPYTVPVWTRSSVTPPIRLSHRVLAGRRHRARDAPLEIRRTVDEACFWSGALGGAELQGSGVRDQGSGVRGMRQKWGRDTVG